MMVTTHRAPLAAMAEQWTKWPKISAHDTGTMKLPR
jgi:hypothetical protein